MAQTEGPCSRAKACAKLSGSALRMKLTSPCLYSVTFFERWRAAATNPIRSNSAPNCCGSGPGYSTNSNPSVTIGLSHRSRSAVCGEPAACEPFIAMPPGKKPNLSSYDVVASVAVAKRRAIYPQTDAICCYDASSDLLRAEPLPMIIKEHGTAEIATPTGPMRLHVFQPAAPGRYPGLVLYSEIFQITAPVRRMAAFLAGNGFL